MKPNKVSGNILDLMTPEHRRQAIARFRQRIKKRENEEVKISPEIFLLSEFGYYYGFAAVRAVRENKISYEEMFILLEGARKVWYTKELEKSNMMRVAVDSSNPLAKRVEKAQAFNKGMKEYRERASIA